MSKRRTAANRKNAAHSTGPKSDAGKQKSSLNALRHGFTGQVVVLPTEDRITYFKHTSAFHNEYHPQGPTETHLVQTLADAAWRLNRLRALEDNLLTIGLLHQEESKTSPRTDHPEASTALATANGTKDHLRQIAILSVHEARLTRQFTKTLSLIKELQAERKANAAPVASLFQRAVGQAVPPVTYSNQPETTGPEEGCQPVRKHVSSIFTTSPLPQVKSHVARNDASVSTLILSSICPELEPDVTSLTGGSSKDHITF